MWVLPFLMSTLSHVKKATAKGSITWIIYSVILHTSLLFKRTPRKPNDWGTEIHGARWRTGPDLPYQGQMSLERSPEGLSLPMKKRGGREREQTQRWEEGKKIKQKEHTLAFSFSVTQEKVIPTMCYLSQNTRNATKLLQLLVASSKLVTTSLNMVWFPSPEWGVFPLGAHPGLLIRICICKCSVWNAKSSLTKEEEKKYLGFFYHTPWHRS